MKTTTATATTVNDESVTTDILLSYSEEEKQQNEVNASNASLIFSPEFIPYYPSVKRDYKLTDTETVLFGFIRFYMGEASKRFYFTNEQLAELVGCTPTYVTKALKRLEEAKLIETSRRMKANGGQIRYVTKCNLLIAKSATSGLQKVQGNKNKISKNKKKNIDTNVSIQAKPASGYGNQEINEVSTYFKEKLNIPREDCSQEQSRRYWHLLLKESKTGLGGVKWLIDQAATDNFWKNNITSSKDLYYKRIKIVARKRGEGGDSHGRPTIRVITPDPTWT